MITYSIQIICFQAIFMATYYFLLRKETFFTYNRIYLLVTLCVSFILPFLKIPFLQNSVPSISLRTLLPEIIIGTPGVVSDISTTGVETTQGFEIPWLLIYITGIIISFIILSVKIYKIAKLYIHSKKGEQLIEIPNSKEAFTLFNHIFIGADIDTLSRKQILNHEHIHVKQKHTWDLAFLEILRVVMWFNPLVYIFQNQLSVLHEYLADQKAVHKTTKKAYYEELLNASFGTRSISFTNTFFNHSLIKKRIVMLQKSKSKKAALTKYALIIPILLGMLFYVSCSEDNFSAENSEEVAFNENFVITKSKIGDNEELFYFLVVKDMSEISKDQLSFVEELKNDESFNSTETKSNNFEVLGAYKGTNEKIALMKKYSIKAYTTDELNELMKESGIIDNTDKTISKSLVIQEELDIPFSIIEEVPVFPGCESLATNKERKECMSNKIAKLVNRNFNTDLGKELNLTGVNRIFVSFKIDKNGYLTNIRSRAPHPDLSEEAERVMQLLPAMEPGKQKGEPVGVLYSLPITFRIAE